MGMISREELIKNQKSELTAMVKILREFYPDYVKLNQAIKKYAILGDGMSELEKHPDKVLEVFLPIIISYGEEHTNGISIRSCFKDAVDALLEKGWMEFYEELRKVR